MKTVRTTVSLPIDQLEKLQRIAERHDLSLAWLVRQAITEFLERIDQGDFHPLTSPKKERD